MQAILKLKLFLFVFLINYLAKWKNNEVWLPEVPISFLITQKILNDIEYIGYYFI